jgi:type I restriction enzyme S subunit
MYRGEMPGACFTNTLIRFQAYRCVLPEFALIVFRRCMHAGRFVDESNITTNIAHLSLGRLSTVEFPVPPLPEQHRIVAEVDHLLSVARATEAEVDANLKRAQGLRQAVLATAFQYSHVGDSYEIRAT